MYFDRVLAQGDKYVLCFHLYMYHSWEIMDSSIMAEYCSCTMYIFISVRQIKSTMTIKITCMFDEMYFKSEKVLVSVHSWKIMGLGPFGGSAKFAYVDFHLKTIYVCYPKFSGCVIRSHSIFHASCLCLHCNILCSIVQAGGLRLVIQTFTSTNDASTAGTYSVYYDFTLGDPTGTINSGTGTFSKALTNYVNPTYV